MQKEFSPNLKTDLLFDVKANQQSAKVTSSDAHQLYEIAPFLIEVPLKNMNLTLQKRVTLTLKPSLLLSLARASQITQAAELLMLSVAASSGNSYCQSLVSVNCLVLKPNHLA